LIADLIARRGHSRGRCDKGRHHKFGRRRRLAARFLLMTSWHVLQVISSMLPSPRQARLDRPHAQISGPGRHSSRFLVVPLHHDSPRRTRSADSPVAGHCGLRERCHVRVPRAGPHPQKWDSLPNRLAVAGGRVEPVSVPVCEWDLVECILRAHDDFWLRSPPRRAQSSGRSEERVTRDPTGATCGRAGRGPGE